MRPQLFLCTVPLNLLIITLHTGISSAANACLKYSLYYNLDVEGALLLAMLLIQKKQRHQIRKNILGLSIGLDRLNMELFHMLFDDLT